MAMQTLKVVRIGNSRGVRLPAQLLSRYRIRESVEVECTASGIVLRPRRDAKLSWEDTFKEMRREQEEKGDEFSDFEATRGDGLSSLDR